MPKVRLYHGTAHAFDAFDDRYTMRGTEPNSALGIHLTEDPALAAEYAEMSAKFDRNAGEPCVLAVDVDVDKIAIVSQREHFLGRSHNAPLEETRGWSEFVQVRMDLIDRGFDGIAGDELGDDLSGVWVIFDPARIQIVDRLSLEAASDIEPDTNWLDIKMESIALFEDDLDAVPDF